MNGLNALDALDTNTVASIQELYTDRSTKPISPEWRYCFIYFLVIIGIVVLLILNLLATFNSFSDKVSIYDPTKVCVEQIKWFKDCMKTSSDDCGNYSELVQTCMNEVDNFNKRCSIYISEFCQCKRGAQGATTACQSELEEIKGCNTVSGLKIDPPEIYNC
jgi:hypothetical protein